MTGKVRGPKGVREGVPGHSTTGFKPDSCFPANVKWPTGGLFTSKGNGVKAGRRPVSRGRLEIWTKSHENIPGPRLFSQGCNGVNIFETLNLFIFIPINLEFSVDMRFPILWIGVLTASGGGGNHLVQGVRAQLELQVKFYEVQSQTIVLKVRLCWGRIKGIPKFSKLPFTVGILALRTLLAPDHKPSVWVYIHVLPRRMI